MRLRATSLRSAPPSSRYRTIAHSAVAQEEQRRPSPPGASTYTPPQSSYVPPVVPTAQIFSSSGDSTASHPMPGDMPREDYMGALVYTTSLLGRLIKYFLLTSLGLGAASVLALEGGHQYIERVCLAGPGEASAEDAAYAWQLEYDDWSGGARGGTDPALGFWIRHLLRSAWVCQELGGGMSAGAIGSEARGGALGDAGVKGMIGSGAMGPTGAAGYVNRVDRGYELAESYIASAIALAEQSGAAAFPPHLSLQRAPLAPSADLHSAILTEKERLGLALLLRQADVLERIGTRTALNRAQEVYERILRFAVDHAAPHGTSGGDALGRAQAATWARKMGDLRNRLGQTDAARTWWAWGLGLAGIPAAAAGADSVVQGMQQPQTSSALLAPPKKTNWFFGWGKGAQPSDTLQQTLAANSEVVPAQSELAPLSPETTQPPLLRAFVSLLSTYAAHLAQDGELAAAEQYEQTALHFLERPVGAAVGRAVAATPTGSSAGQAHSAAGRLQLIWERQRAALAQLHLAEIRFARAGDVAQGLRDLSRAVRGAEASITSLGGNNAPTSSQTDSEIYYPHDAPPVHPAPLASSFSAATRAPALGKPAQDLLKDAQRTAAQGWYLSGALYERSARRTVTATSPGLPTSDARELHELAFECYDRAVGWARLADGSSAGAASVDEDVEGGLAAGIHGGEGERAMYWRAYARMRGVLEDQVQGV